MFRSLGLFASLPCPEKVCRLRGCLFKHVERVEEGRPTKRRKVDNHSTVEQTDTQAHSNGQSYVGPSKKEDVLKSQVEEASPSQSRKAASQPQVDSSSSRSMLKAGTLKGISRILPTSTVQIVTGPITGINESAASASEPNAQTSSILPTVPVKSDPRYISRATETSQINIKLDPLCSVAHESRLHYLRLYKQQFERIYAAFDNEIFDKLVVDHAIEQEKYVVSKNGKGTYKQASRNALVALNKRSLAQDTTDVGIYPAYKPPMKKVIDWTSFVHEPRTLKAWGYTVDIPTPDTTLKSEEGCDRVCDRCNQRFVVTAHQAQWLSCTYHPGRPTYKTTAGIRTSIWNCCESHSAEGCTVAPTHVFKISHAPRLAAYIPYSTLPGPLPSANNTLEVVALDCEMVYTIASMELARVSVTTKDGSIILDELVRPVHAILDLNTRFSGISQSALSSGKAITRAELLQKFAKLGITKDTIIIGHGLENDLTALRLVHLRVIDSAILFPHPRGRPYRNGLKYLVKRYLNKDIQMNNVTTSKIVEGHSNQTPTTPNSIASKVNGAVGHDPSEDARGALELVIWKASHGKEKVGDEPFAGKLK